jgi:NitT/TauT family transport system substrate-binding protein
MKLKRIFKAVLLFTAALLAAAGFAACGDKGEAKTISIYVPDGAPILSVAQMRSGDAEIAAGYKTEWTTVNADLLTEGFIKGTPDIAVAPINLGAKMYNEGRGYRFAGVSIWGIMHLVSDLDIQSLDELKGQTVFAFTKGGTPGITLRSLLTQYGIEYVEDQKADIPAGKVNIYYRAEASDVREVIATVKDGANGGQFDGLDVHYALLAEPVVTAVKGVNPAFNHTLNFQTLWQAKNDGGKYPQAGLFFHERLLNKDVAFLDKFISEVAVSTEWALNNPLEAGDLVKANGEAWGSAAIPGGAPVQAAVAGDRLPLIFNYASEAATKTAVSNYLEIIKNENANLVGGKLPDETFYYHGVDAPQTA